MSRGSRLRRSALSSRHRRGTPPQPAEPRVVSAPSEVRSEPRGSTDNVLPATTGFAFVTNFEPGGSLCPGSEELRGSPRVVCAGGFGYDGNIGS